VLVLPARTLSIHVIATLAKPSRNLEANPPPFAPHQSKKVFLILFVYKKKFLLALAD
jgi:hypothetical protein